VRPSILQSARFISYKEEKNFAKPTFSYNISNSLQVFALILSKVFVYDFYDTVFVYGFFS